MQAPPNLPLVSREWKTGSNSSYKCTPFLLTKGKLSPNRLRGDGPSGRASAGTAGSGALAA